MSLKWITFCCVQEFLKLTVDLADLVGIYFVMQRVAGKGQVKVSFSRFKVLNVARKRHLIVLSWKYVMTFSFLLDPDRWCGMGFCRFSPHEGNISMGWSKRNWIWLEIYAKKLWCKYRLGEFTNITRFRTSLINFSPALME